MSLRPAKLFPFIGLFLLIPSFAFGLEITSPPAWLAPHPEKSLLLDLEKIGDRLIAVGDRGHILVSDDKGATWQQKQTPSQAMLTSLTRTTQNTLIAVGHDSLILNSYDKGESWSPRFVQEEWQQPLLTVNQLPNGEILALGAYGLALRSLDEGASWEETNLIDDYDAHLNALTTTNTKTSFIAAEFGDLLRKNIDEEWEQIDSPYAGSFFGALSTQNSQLYIFGLQGHLYRSSDNGNTWTALQTGTKSALMGATEAQDQTIYIVGMAGTILRSNDAGQSFEKFTHPSRTDFSDIIEISKDHFLLVGASGPLHLTPSRDLQK